MRRGRRWTAGTPLALRLLRALCRSLTAYGAPYAGVDPESTVTGPSPAGSGPAGAHPERVRPDVPLTPSERAHARELGSP
ncbi:MULTISPECIES: DUF6059 family protein [Streptomyces]|uniref:Secreted protein n=1 Tax=Streptomyces glycanivorans TaxID=3033808 RepID=A0ABY9JJ18_9ACTN|nr:MULTISPECIES: DUF6059 family protein [unclassified Streptomyces]WSQ81054.1 hypothetical protein OG725_29935 [Streptomyces sp. NBC_01213]TXS10361.1 hypothetical protein EAO68_26595 [Streptomyces sp. wa22]WLQ67713.1 hypothetical protein P8A20_30970 [Streptomyces sp. Alt3]WSQ88384.1 hypothetical protein OG722_30350 [Streptomyces sp. NBC_01212]WSR05608.1 hypothetical protein OG265_06150 [Streptomyces sp. NBC_01208]